MTAAHKQSGFRIGLSMAVLMTGASCSSIPVIGTLGLRISKENNFTIAQSDTKTCWGCYGFPAVEVAYKSVLVVGYNTMGDGTGIGEPDLEPAVSRDAGKTWQYGDAELKKEVGEQGIIHGIHFLLKDGSVAVVDFYKRLIYRSPDGRVWSEGDPIHYEQPFPSRLTVALQYPSEVGSVGPDGTMYCAGYYDVPGEEIGSTPGVLHSCLFIYKSEDGGLNWTVHHIADRRNTPWGSEGPNEASIVALPNGDLYVVCRTGAGGGGSKIKSSDPMLEARSTDRGKTWRLRRMGQSGVCPKLLLMSNGVLVCTYGRPGNTIIFSLNGGRSWGKEITLSAPDAPTTGYADAAEVAPGRLLVVWDLWETSLAKFWLWEPPRPVNAVMGTFLNVHYHP